MGSGEEPAKAVLCALRLTLGMFVDSGEVLSGGNLLSNNSVDGAGDKGPRGAVVFFPLSAPVGVLLSDREVMEGELGLFHLGGSSASFIMLVGTLWFGTVCVTVTGAAGAAGAGDEDKLLSQLLRAEPGSGNERTVTVCEGSGWLTEIVIPPAVKR